MLVSKLGSPSRFPERHSGETSRRRNFDAPAIYSASRLSNDPGLRLASGADPSVTVAAPLDRKLGQIAEVEPITVTSSLGMTSIQLQFSIRP